MAHRGKIIKGSVSMCFDISANWIGQYFCGGVALQEWGKKNEIQMHKTMSPR